MTITDKQYAALVCAINVLQGTGGGYTEREKQDAGAVLGDMIERATFTVTRAAGSGK